MFTRIVWVLLALGYIIDQSVAQDTAFHFTSGVSNPVPVPGQPFTLTWTGGQSDETVYIILNYLFPDTPNQNIVYITTDILSNAPNNGSWVWHVPLNINQGRYTFSIGENPFLLSDSTGVFTILSSQTSSVAPGPSASATTTYPVYNSCGLPPVPDYTYTGYQPPCTTTIDGQVETLYPIVPSSDSSLFYGTSALGQATVTTGSASVLLSSSPTKTSTSINTAFASGVFAQALQCATSITPSATTITVGGTTTIFSTVGCNTGSGSTITSGVCHSSGYTTFSISGTNSVCCPNGWATTPLDSQLYCFTSIEQNAERFVMKEQQISTESSVAGSSPLLTISGLAFTRAGIVMNETQAKTSGSSSSRSGSTSATTTATKNGSLKLRMDTWQHQFAIAVSVAIYHALS